MLSFIFFVNKLTTRTKAKKNCNKSAGRIRSSLKTPIIVGSQLKK